MPFKKRNHRPRRKRVNRNRNRPMRKRGHRKTQELLIYNNVKQAPVPSRYRCNFMTQFYGYVAAGATGGTYTANVNGLYGPVVGSWPNSTPSAATLQPTGYTSLLNINLYNQYRVYGSSILVEFLPESLVDTIQVVIVPSMINYFGSYGTGYLMGQEHAKSGLMSASKDDHNSKKGGSELRNSITMHKLLGVSPKAIEDDLSGKFVSSYNNNPSNTALWGVSWVTPDGSALSANCKYRVTLIHHTECYQPYNIHMLET